MYIYICIFTCVSIKASILPSLDPNHYQYDSTQNEQVEKRIKTPSFLRFCQVHVLGGALHGFVRLVGDGGTLDVDVTEPRFDECQNHWPQRLSKNSLDYLRFQPSEGVGYYALAFPHSLCCGGRPWLAGQVFAYGLDLFFTPFQSAKAYDVLRPAAQWTRKNA